MLHTLATPAVLALVLGAVSAFPAAGRSQTKVGYVRVSVTTLWTDSSKPRPVDAPALTNPVNMGEWLGDMTLADFLDLSASDRTQTQALYGAPVDILDYQDGWYSVAVPGQPTPKNTLGYPGWVPADQVTFDDEYGRLKASLPFAQVDGNATAPLYRDIFLTEELLQVSYDTRLPVLGQIFESIHVAVPGGLAYLSAQHATVYGSMTDIPYPTGEQLIEAGKLFLGQPYLWGGASGYAFDCSGLTHTLYDAHGITIARDSDAQADFTPGVKVADAADLQPGDLIFYASNTSDPSTIYHVAMYAGGGQMLEAYASGVPVRITPVRFIADYWGAERYLTPHHH